MVLLELLKSELKLSLKEANNRKSNALRSILSLAQQIAKEDKNREMTDDDIITAAIKLNKEAIEGKEIYKNLDGSVAQDNYLKNVLLETVCSMFLPEQKHQKK